MKTFMHTSEIEDMPVEVWGIYKDKFDLYGKIGFLEELLGGKAFLIENVLDLSTVTLGANGETFADSIITIENVEETKNFYVLCHVTHDGGGCSYIIPRAMAEACPLLVTTIEQTYDYLKSLKDNANNKT